MSRFYSVFLFIVVVSCQFNWHGDIELGGDYYYNVDPDFNSINIPVNPEKPFVSSNFVIQDVEQVGFNKKNILVISNFENKIAYWWIDKTKESKKIGFDDGSILRMSNLSQIDSIRFEEIKDANKIEMKTKTYYRKKLNYE